MIRLRGGVWVVTDENSLMLKSEIKNHSDNNFEKKKQEKKKTYNTLPYNQGSFYKGPYGIRVIYKLLNGACMCIRYS